MFVVDMVSSVQTKVFSIKYGNHAMGLDVPLMKLSSEKQARSVPFRISVKYDKKRLYTENLFLTKGRRLQIGLYPKKGSAKTYLCRTELFIYSRLPG